MRKEFAPPGSKFFPHREDPFQKRIGVQGGKNKVTKVVSLTKNGGKSIICFQSS